MGGLGIAEIAAGLAKPFFGLIDELVTTDEEKAKARLVALEMQVNMAAQLLDYEKERMKLQQQVITAEAQSASAITRMWRPITMLTFLAMVVSFWLGYAPANVEPYLPELFSLIKLGLGGYVVGRSAEKVIPQVANIFKDKA